MKIINLFSITALFLSLSMGESYAVTKNGKVWVLCAVGATTAAIFTTYTANKTKETFKKAYEWNLEEEIKKQREKEVNAHTVFEKLRAYHDSFFVNRLGQLRDYSESASWATTTVVSGLATAIFVAAPFVLNDKQLKRRR